MTMPKKRNGRTTPEPVDTDLANDVAAIVDLVRMLPQTYVERFPLADLVDFPGNPKDHDLGAIGESIDANAWYGAILAQRWPDTPTYVLAGHGRRAVLLARGQTQAPVILLGCDPRTARRIVLADNRVAELGGFNLPALAAFAAEMARDGEAALRGTGYDADDVQSMAAKLAAPASFPSFGADIPTEHRCPKCGYEWSGAATAGGE